MSYAALFSGCIRGISLSCESIKLDINESPIHQASIATIVENRTVDKLLFRKIESIVCFFCKDKSWFEGACSRESPARSALTLVLNSSNSSCSNPVNINFNIRNWVLSCLINNRLFNDEIEVNGSKFFLSKISEDSNTQISRFIILNDLEIFSKNLHSVNFHISTRKFQAIFWLVRQPLSNDVFSYLDIRRSLEIRLEYKQKCCTTKQQDAS